MTVDMPYVKKDLAERKWRKAWAFEGAESGEIPDRGPVAGAEIAGVLETFGGLAFFHNYYGENTLVATLIVDDFLIFMRAHHGNGVCRVCVDSTDPIYRISLKDFEKNHIDDKHGKISFENKARSKSYGK